MNKELRDIVEQKVFEWEDLFDKVPDPDSLVRKSIDVAIEHRIAEHAALSVREKTYKIAEQIAEKALQKWIDEGEITVVLPDAEVRKQVEDVFLESKTWPENVISRSKKRLAKIHRLSVIEGVSSKVIAREFKVTVREAESLIERSKKHAEDVSEMHKAFFG